MYLVLNAVPTVSQTQQNCTCTTFLDVAGHNYRHSHTYYSIVNVKLISAARPQMTLLCYTNGLTITVRNHVTWCFRRNNQWALLLLFFLCSTRFTQSAVVMLMVMNCFSEWLAASIKFQWLVLPRRSSTCGFCYSRACTRKPHSIYRMCHQLQNAAKPISVQMYWLASLGHNFSG